MSRYIIECDDPTDIVLGMRSIKALLGKPLAVKDMICSYENGGMFYVKRTKTGFSARKGEAE